MIHTHRIHTCMGKMTGGDKLPFLTEEEQKEFDNIGYSGKKINGEKVSRVSYLNSLGKGEFEITQTKWDSGDFCESFILIRVNNEQV